MSVPSEYQEICDRIASLDIFGNGETIDKFPSLLNIKCGNDYLQLDSNYTSGADFSFGVRAKSGYDQTIGTLPLVTCTWFPISTIRLSTTNNGISAVYDGFASIQPLISTNWFIGSYNCGNPLTRLSQNNYAVSTSMENLTFSFLGYKTTFTDIATALTYIEQHFRHINLVVDDDAWIDVTPPTYTWQSVPSISGKNGILNLSQIASASINNGEAVSGASASAFTSLTAQVSTMVTDDSEMSGADAGGISGSGSNSGDQSSGYAFGQGESGTNVSGGGSGYYGGEKGGSLLSGGAGSGYIGNALVSNKKMVGYNVPTSSAEGTKTESVNVYSAINEANKPKAGNGFARIKYIGEPPFIKEYLDLINERNGNGLDFFWKNETNIPIYYNGRIDQYTLDFNANSYSCYAHQQDIVSSAYHNNPFYIMDKFTINIIGTFNSCSFSKTVNRTSIKLPNPPWGAPGTYGYMFKMFGDSTENVQYLEIPYGQTNPYTSEITFSHSGTLEENLQYLATYFRNVEVTFNGSPLQ